MITFPVKCCGETHCVRLFDDDNGTFDDIYLVNHFQDEIESQLAMHELGAEPCPCVSFLHDMDRFRGHVLMEDLILYNLLSSRSIGNDIRLRCLVDSVEYIIKNSRRVMGFYREEIIDIEDVFVKIKDRKKYKRIIKSTLQYIEAVRRSGYKVLPKKPVCHGSVHPARGYLLSGLRVFMNFLQYSFHERACWIMNGEFSGFLAWMEKGAFVSYGDLLIDRDEDGQRKAYDYKKPMFNAWMSTMIMQILEESAREAGCDV